MIPDVAALQAELNGIYKERNHVSAPACCACLQLAVGARACTCWHVHHVGQRLPEAAPPRPRRLALLCSALQLH